MKKRDIVTLIVLGIIFIFIFVIIMINNSNEEEKKEKTEFNNLSLLENESIFLTVSNSINKICEYSNNKLALNYILKENDNNDYSNMSFKAEEIYVVSNLELYKYYVEGSFYREIMDTRKIPHGTQFFPHMLGKSQAHRRVHGTSLV